MQQLLVVVELQKIKLSIFLLAGAYKGWCQVYIVVFIKSIPKGYASKLEVRSCQRQETIVEDEGFIHYFVFNTVSLECDKVCYKMERNQLCATINSVYH